MASKCAKHCFHALAVPRNHAQGTIKIVRRTPDCSSIKALRTASHTCNSRMLTPFCAEIDYAIHDSNTQRCPMPLRHRASLGPTESGYSMSLKVFSSPPCGMCSRLAALGPGDVAPPGCKPSLGALILPATRSAATVGPPARRQSGTRRRGVISEAVVPWPRGDAEWQFASVPAACARRAWP